MTVLLPLLALLSFYLAFFVRVPSVTKIFATKQRYNLELKIKWLELLAQLLL